MPLLKTARARAAWRWGITRGRYHFYRIGANTLQACLKGARAVRAALRGFLEAFPHED